MKDDNDRVDAHAKATYAAEVAVKNLAHAVIVGSGSEVDIRRRPSGRASGR